MLTVDLNKGFAYQVGSTIDFEVEIYLVLRLNKCTEVELHLVEMEVNHCRVMQLTGNDCFKIPLLF